MGIHTITRGVSYIATSETWIEGSAIQQLETTAQLPSMHTVVGMPDLHPGRGYPIGAAFFSDRFVYPALVGGDIGCGMSLFQTDLMARKWSSGALDKRIGNIDGELHEEWNARIQALCAAQSLVLDPLHRASLGTIGGGNHFAEFLRVDTLYISDAEIPSGLDKRALLLLVHSGSRGLGQSILQQHVQQFQHQGIEHEDAQAYMQRHHYGLQYAYVNRQLIAQRILQNVRAQGMSLLDVFHNFVAPVVHEGVSGWLHRKGACPADAGLVVIPGSRGDYSYLVQPVADPCSLYSIAHGAGRKWIRQACKDRLSPRFRFDQLSRTSLGSTVICNHRELMYEEAPQAYKDIESVIVALESLGLVRRIARLCPVLTYKTRGECCE